MTWLQAYVSWNVCPRTDGYNSGSEESLNPMNKTVDEFNVTEHAEKVKLFVVDEATVGFNE